jgi:hypothetical protein
VTRKSLWRVLGFEAPHGAAAPRRAGAVRRSRTLEDELDGWQRLKILPVPGGSPFPASAMPAGQWVSSIFFHRAGPFFLTRRVYRVILGALPAMAVPP